MEYLAELVNQIHDAAKVAELTPNEPEAKLRELVSPIWERFLKEKHIGLNLQISDEFTLANGRADTVFNKLILEYKKPRTIKAENAKNRQLISQVQGYILDLAKKERFSKERLLGVAFDGNYFLFMRYAKRWIEEEPVSLNEDSLELFLKNLEKLTSKAALIPENLIRDFAVGRESRNKVAVDCIKAFYNELNEHGGEGDTKEHVFFEQWKTQFAEVHGSLEQKKIDTKTLFTSYGFSKSEQKDFNVLAFFFALDSYYALLMKLLSYQVVGFYTLKELAGLPLHNWESLSSQDLRAKCEELEEGGIFRNLLGIRNFLEGDLFSWYTQAWNEPIYKAIKQIANHLNDYDPETMEIAPDETRDILKKLYQYLVPKEIRHDLGEYYTPDWLAERCLNQVSYGEKRKDLSSLRILDCGCGSGTFLILAIKRAKENAKLLKIPPAETLMNILRNIHGFDLNPLAVISARTNYMLAIADLLKYRPKEITIPIYLCDSINPPEGKIDDSIPLFPQRLPYLVKTSVEEFYFSHSIITKGRVQRLANIMEDCVKAHIAKQDFLNKVKTELDLNTEEYEESELYLDDTYDKLMKLDRVGINGIWARIIKNAFAPLFVGRFDIVVGNPPWVNWESLPGAYRDETKPLWVDYGLFSLRGHEARLGGGKKDISMLMTYTAIDKYLKAKGRLCFVITQTLFKSQGAGDGFRRFRLGEQGLHFKIEQVDDMVKLQPFEGAANRTAIVSIQKGIPTTYPTPYTLWRKVKKGAISMDLTYHEVFGRTKRSNLKAKPIGHSPTSPWLTGKGKAIDVINKCIGQSFYKAVAGSCTWLNGVFWGRATDLENDLVNFENESSIGDIKVDSLSVEIEPTLIFPLLRGKEISRWSAKPELSIIVSQNPATRVGYDETWMTEHVPRTLEYLAHFHDKLEARSGYKKYLQGAPYYSMYNVGPYTFAPYKVVWKGLADGSQATVVGKASVGREPKVVIPEHNTMLVPFQNEKEAHYFCALFNCSVTSFVIIGYIAWFYSTHVLTNIAIPQFDLSNRIHQELSRLSRYCHQKAAVGIDITDLEEQVDELAAGMWGLTPEELQDVKASLEELR